MLIDLILGIIIIIALIVNISMASAAIQTKQHIVVGSSFTAIMLLVMWLVKMIWSVG